MCCLNNDDKRMIANGLNHYKTYLKKDYKIFAEEYTKVELAEVEALAKRLELNRDYFMYDAIK